MRYALAAVELPMPMQGFEKRIDPTALFGLA